MPAIDVDRSLFVSPTAPADQAALRARFSVSRIMSHILATGGTARPADGTDIPLLVEKFYEQYAGRTGAPKTLVDELAAHDWPGKVQRAARSAIAS